MRKNTGEPYFVHPERVATRLKSLLKERVTMGYMTSDDFDDIISAAYLHDVVEDCDVPIQEIENCFGKTIAKYVAELTSDKKFIAAQMAAKHIKKYEAKGIYLAEKFNEISSQARYVKLADREDNVKDLSQVLPDNITWVGEYSAETAYILDHINVDLDPVEKILVASIRKTIRPYLL